MIRKQAAIALFAGATTWNMGNAGPIVTPISEEFSVSLGVVGLLSGTALYGALLAANVSTPILSKRIGAANGARAACLCCGAGNVVFALAPTFTLALGGGSSPATASGWRSSLAPRLPARRPVSVG